MKWDNDIYRQKFGFKTQTGLELAAQVKPVRGKLLELGSETGILSYQLWKLGYTVEGIEFDYKLVDLARRTTAKSVFYEGDVDDVLLYENNYVMAIANDVLHRVPAEHHENFLDNVYRSMKPEAELAFDMGAEGNNQPVEDALVQAFADEGLEYRMPFYPAENEYRTMLENAGFHVDRLVTVSKDRRIPGEDGMHWYIEMFYRDAFRKMDDAVIDRIIDKACTILEDTLYDGENWTLPQIRLTGKLVKQQ